MKNLMNEITTNYLNLLESGYIYGNNCYYEIIQHPHIPGVLLRKKYELAIFKKDKLLIYPRVKGDAKNDKAFKLYPKDIKFMLPAIYSRGKLLEEIDAEYIKICTESTFNLKVSNVHRRDTYIALYKKPYEIIFNNDKYIIGGEYVTLFSMNYQNIETENYIYDYDENAVTLRYNSVDPLNMAGLWYEYSILTENYSGTKYTGLFKILSEYIHNNNIKDSLYLETITLESGEKYPVKDTTLRCVESHLQEFIYDNPRYANVDKLELDFMYNLLHMLSVDIPTRTVMKISNVKEILSFVLRHCMDDSNPYRAEDLFGLNTPSIFIRSDYTKISYKHSKSPYKGIPVKSFYEEFYPIIDLIVGLLNELDKRMVGKKYPVIVSKVSWALKTIYWGYEALVPEYTAKTIIGKYSVEKEINTKSIGENIKLSV